MRPITPECPEDMPKVAKEWWAKAISVLSFAGLIGERDWAILELAARHWARWKQAEAEVDEFGITFESLITMDANGKIVEPDDPSARFGKTTRRENPACRTAAREAQAFERCIRELGFSPVAWARIAAPKAKRDATGLLDVG